MEGEKKPHMFQDQRKDPYQKFQHQLLLNPYYPFTRLPDGNFVYTSRFFRLWVSLGAFAVFALLTLILGVSGAVGTSWFVFAAAGTLATLFAVRTFRHRREYFLDMNRGLYRLTNIGFRSRTLVVESTLNNIYIRMRKKHAGGISYYYLVLNGYMLNKQILTGATVYEESLRELGQMLAANLNLNYFDEANVSAHRASPLLRRQVERVQRSDPTPKRGAPAQTSSSTGNRYRTRSREPRRSAQTQLRRQ